MRFDQPDTSSPPPEKGEVVVYSSPPPVQRGLHELARERVHDGHLIGRMAWSCVILLCATFSWIVLTLAIVTSRHWAITGLIAADGGVLLIAVSALLLTWVWDGWD